MARRTTYGFTIAATGKSKCLHVAYINYVESSWWLVVNSLLTSSIVKCWGLFRLTFAKALSPDLGPQIELFHLLEIKYSAMALYKKKTCYAIKDVGQYTQGFYVLLCLEIRTNKRCDTRHLMDICQVMEYTIVTYTFTWFQLVANICW